VVLCESSERAKYHSNQRISAAYDSGNKTRNNFTKTLLTTYIKDFNDYTAFKISIHDTISHVGSLEFTISY